MNRYLLNIYNFSIYFNNNKYRILWISLFILIKHIFLWENYMILIWCKNEIWRWINWLIIEKYEKWRFFWKKRDILIYILIISNEFFFISFILTIKLFNFNILIEILITYDFIKNSWFLIKFFFIIFFY